MCILTRGHVVCLLRVERDFDFYWWYISCYLQLAPRVCTLVLFISVFCLSFSHLWLHLYTSVLCTCISYRCLCMCDEHWLDRSCVFPANESCLANPYTVQAQTVSCIRFIPASRGTSVAQWVEDLSRVSWVQVPSEAVEKDFLRCR